MSARRSIPLGLGWSLALDRSQVFPDDPGQGTPAMVYGPFGLSATLWCAEDMGEATNSRGEDVAIPASVLRQLERVRDEAVEWVGA